MAYWKCPICGEVMDYSLAKAHMQFRHIMYVPEIEPYVMEG